MIVGMLSSVCVICIIIIIVCYKLYKRAEKDFDDSLIKIKENEEKYAKLLHQKKSSEVRLGRVGENLAPFTEKWPWDINNFRFLGSPIDGVQFNEDEVLIIEIKTGNSRLSKNQKYIKELVEQGKVRFVSYKITPNGVVIE